MGRNAPRLPSPRRTDIVVWEMGINDWDPNDSNLPRRVWHQQAFELFVRRTLSVNPKAVIVMVSLWQSVAAKCWPRCPDDRGEFDDIVEVAEAYAAASGIPFFALDFNRMSKLLGVSGNDLFRDAHHPSLMGHLLIGDALRLSFLFPMLNSATKRAMGAHDFGTSTRPPAVLPRAYPRSKRHCLRRSMLQVWHLTVPPALEGVPGKSRSARLVKVARAGAVQTLAWTAVGAMDSHSYHSMRRPRVRAHCSRRFWT